MAGIVPKLTEIETDEDSDSELSNVFMGPITKKELLAPIKKKKNIPSQPKTQVGTPKVTAHINLVTPAKESGSNKPLDLSVKKLNPMVVDLSTTPVASKTIVITDTPKFASFLNESDFMDESDMGISVDNVLVDLNRDIESEMEYEMREADMCTQSQNESTLHPKLFTNITDQLNGTTPQAIKRSHAEQNQIKLDDTNQVNFTHTSINNSNVQINKSKNQSPTDQILNESSLNRNSSQGILSINPNEISQISSELSSVLNTTEEQSSVFGKDSSTENGKSYQDVLSESFQYYTGSDLNKENDSNQLNHVANSPVLKDENTHLDQTFDKLSLSHSKIGSIHNFSTNPAEDTLEEIDILETYGYKTAEKDKNIPTINILSATIVEEVTDDTEDFSQNNKSVPLMNVSITNKSKKVNGEDILETSNQEVLESSNEVNEESNNSVNELNAHIRSEVSAADYRTEIVKPPIEECMEQDDLSMNNISQMLADTSIQTKEKSVLGVGIAKTSAQNSESCVDILSRDSCVGLYETVNATLGENMEFLSPCPELQDAPDDLNLSIIDNTDATNHWQEVNSANNTTYIDLSPIKKNTNNQEVFDQISVEGTQTDHTYAYGEPSNSQCTKSESNNSGNNEEEIVQVIYTNTSKKLLSIVEENEPMDKDIDDVEEKSKEIEVKSEVEIPETCDISMRQSKEIPENSSSVFVDESESNDPLKKTFSEVDATDNAVEMDCDPSNLSTVKTKRILESTPNKNESMKTFALASENSLIANKTNVKTNQSLLENSVKKTDEDMKEQSLKATSYVFDEKLNPEFTDSPKKSSSHAAGDTIKTVNQTTDVKEDKLCESKNLKTTGNQDIEEGECAISPESIKTVDSSIIDETEQVNKTNAKVTDHVNLSVQNKNVSLKNKTLQIDHCNNTAQETFEHTTIDECDFKSVVQKYKENTGVELSTTSELPPFNLESFSKPRYLKDDLNSSSPDVESIKQDQKRSTIKPKTQIPMSNRANVLRPTKFTTENIKKVSKPPSNVLSSEKPKPLDGIIHKIQKENLAPVSPRIKATSLTPARSISQTLVSSISSFANKITGRTPRKENTPKIKSPEPVNTKSSKLTSQMRSPKPILSSSKPGPKSPNVSSNFKFTPMLAKFKNVPSSTPAVKVVSQTPTPRHKTPGPEEEGKQGIRKSLSASKVEGQHKTLSSQTKFDHSLNNRKLDFKNVESKIGSIRKPDELPSLQKAVKSPLPSTAKTSLIKPPKFTGSKLPSLLPASIPVKRTSKFMNVQSPIGAYIRDGSKVMNDSKKHETSFIPRKLMKLNQSERQSSVKTAAVEKGIENSFGNSVSVSADVSMGESPATLLQNMISSDTMQHTAL